MLGLGRFVSPSVLIVTVPGMWGCGLRPVEYNRWKIVVCSAELVTVSQLLLQAFESCHRNDSLV